MEDTGRGVRGIPGILAQPDTPRFQEDTNLFAPAAEEIEGLTNLWGAGMSEEAEAGFNAGRGVGVGVADCEGVLDQHVVGGSSDSRSNLLGVPSATNGIRGRRAPR